MFNKVNLKRSKSAILIMLLVLTLVVCYIGYRFFCVAITKRVDNVNLEQRAQTLYRTQSKVTAKRGQIYDAVGNVLAENASVYTIQVVLQKDQPSYVKASQIGEVAQQLAKYLGGSASDYEKTMTNGRKNKYFQVQFGTRGSNIAQDKYLEIKKAKIPGVTFESHPARLYPNGQFASDLIGAVSAQGTDSLKGISGIEAAWNKKLTGKDGINTTSQDSTDVDVAKVSLATKNGYDIYTTLNTKLQSALESKMDALQSDLQPKQAFAAMIDTKTGNIVAETQRPTYNATTQKDFGKFWSNLLVQEPYEPGSVMKGITLASAIDSGNWDGNATYQSGTIQINDKEVKDWNDGVGWGRISYSDGIALSSNVAMVLTEQKMGADTWQKYLNKFLFLKPTQIGFNSEASGSMNFRYPIEQASTAFGQGIKTTPAQMLQAYSAIADNGDEIKPHIISKIVDPNTKKVIYAAKREKVGKPITAETAKATREELENVIYSSKAIGRMYAIPDVRTTGKSGTAQISTASGYSSPGDNKNEIHSWMGMAPSDNPRYMMYIVVKEPQKNTGNLAKDMSNVFVSMMQQALQMTPADDKIVVSSKQQVKIPTVENESISAAKKEIEANRLAVEVMGNGKKVITQYPKGGQASLINQRIILNTGGDISVPNMQGWSKSDVMAWGSLAKIKINASGEGFLTEQSVLANTALSDGIHEITVKFVTPQ
ncbi:penicillin-binding protein [Weissella diestrammenae]|uniref:Penicillin-binding protein n=1 Tax=Weissella diestrammenae TaxID=1162633 RepID=A0A7G9T639_9LACO|nr:penicillin-binding transpeptidase domain-containing protein [Weissella diestrammenae]MCM0582400.1 penicillin-binding protein [Weissella diestrammenae]QNN75564.1 penicillin-binding protein [Weissella diestrammenae]